MSADGPTEPTGESSGRPEYVPGQPSTVLGRRMRLDAAEADIRRISRWLTLLVAVAMAAFVVGLVMWWT